MDGVLDYNFGNFKLLVTSVPPKVSGGLTKETTALVGTTDQVTVASFNVENLDPTDPPDKFAGLAQVIVHNLQSPDVVGLEEIQDNTGPVDDHVLDANVTLDRLAQAVVDARGPHYAYRQINPIDDAEGGEPGGNIRVGFFFDPFNGTSFFVVANHWTSKGGDDPLFGRFQPPSFSSENQRIEQARIVRDFVSSVLSIDASARVIVDGGILVSPALVPVVEYDAVHVNAEFQNQVSDHDPQITRYRFSPPATPTPTATPTATATASPTAIATSTSIPVDIGSKGFTLRNAQSGSVALSWTGGSTRPATSCCGPRSPAA